MSDDSQHALKLESDFLAGVESNFEEAKGKLFRGSIWERTEADEEDRLRGTMARHRNYDKSLLKQLPKNRRVSIHGFDRSWIFWKKRTCVAVASVLTPMEHYASGDRGEAPPIDLGELIEHVRKLAGDRKVKHIIGVCSPSGFTAEARTARLDLPNAGVVLIEPDGSGGWSTVATGDGIDEDMLRLFDAEEQTQKLERVAQVIDEHSAQLLTGGLTASVIAEKVNLPEPLVRQAFDKISQTDPELRMTKKQGEAILFRGAPVTRQEKSSMSVIDRIKQLLSGEGDENEKINLLSERRATLAQRRDRIYEDISKLEKREQELLSEGRAATSAVPKRRLAAQLSQLRKDIGRQNTTAAMLNKQIDIISTDIHNLTLIKQGEAAQLPDSQELTEHAVQAEEMLETLQADADMVSSLETGIEESLASEEELAILKEFEMDPSGQEPESGEQAAAGSTESSRAPARGEDALAAESPGEAVQESGDPEPLRPDQKDAEPS
ncbi:MAG: hypothetical protein ACYTHJ_01175 [Planctomycetota bacterium]